MMSSNFRDDELVKVQGKKYPLVGGRLRLAHDENDQLSISTNLLSLTDDRVVIQARVETKKGNFSGIGNASAKRDRMLANALIELAETRAVARALRFAGYGVEYTGFEEMGDSAKETGEHSSPASKSQLEAVASMAKMNNISPKELHELMAEVTGKDKSRDLTSEDVSKLIAALKLKNKDDSKSIS